jgi:hypothetical protein
LSFYALLQKGEPRIMRFSPVRTRDEKAHDQNGSEHGLLQRLFAQVPECN